MNFNNEEVLLDTPVEGTEIAAKNGIETEDTGEAIFSSEFEEEVAEADETDPSVRAENILTRMNNATYEIKHIFIDPSQKAAEIGLGEIEGAGRAVKEYTELVARISANYDHTKKMIASLTVSVTTGETVMDIETDEVVFTEIESKIEQLASDSAKLLTEEVGAPEQEASGDKNITPEEGQSGLEKSPQMSKAEFDAEFSKVFAHEFMGEQLSYAKIEPNAEQLRNQDWVVFVGGFNTAKESYYNELLNLAQSGRKILFINPETVAEIEDGDDGITSSIPLTIRSEAAALSSVMEQEGIAKADFVAHSRGGAVATTLIAKNPGIAKRILLDSPAGITGKAGRASLLKRSFTEFGSDTAAKIKKGIMDKISGRVAVKPDHPNDDFETRLKKNLGWKLRKEIPAIAGTDIRPLLQHIKHSADSDDDSTAPEIILINGHSDHIFTSDKVEQGLGADPFTIVDRWIEYIEKDASHGKIDRREVGLYPQAMATEESGPERASVISALLSEKDSA